MKTFTFSTLKTVFSAGLVVALLGTTFACTTVTPSYDNQKVYRQQGNNHGNVVYKNNGRYNQGNYNNNGHYDNDNNRYKNKKGHYKNNKGRYNNNGRYNKNKGRYNNNGRYINNNYHYK